VIARATTTAPSSGDGEPAPAAASGAALEWNRAVALGAYTRPDLRRGLGQLAGSGLGLAFFWYLAFRSLDVSYLLTLLLAIPAAFMTVRLFIVQHDCGHGSFFPWRQANDGVGFVLGIFTLTPYAYWRRVHALHHATSGNLDRRGFGDIVTLTVREYLARGRWGRLSYRLYRNPLVLLVVGPAFQFFLRHRLPTIPLRWRREWASVLWTNLGLAGLILLMVKWVGFGRFLEVQLPISWIAGSIGVWLFYVQHQFEEAYWEREGEWSFEAAGLHGSSYYDLPSFLHWCTGNIGFHHVHHLCSRIPNYRLKDCCAATSEVAAAPRVTLGESLRCLRLKLWDEQRGRLVGFDLDRAPEGPAATS